MKIFKHKENNKNYTIEIIKNPYPFLDGATRLGVWAHPYLWGDTYDIIFFKSTDFDGACTDFIKNNFIEISEE
jgi:hypothetical protein